MTSFACPACARVIVVPPRAAGQRGRCPGCGAEAVAPTQASATVGVGPGATGQSPRRLGRYLLEAELGRGGMGVVYRAQDEHLRRAVAVKTLLVGQERDVEARERFRREAEAAGRLRHPGIVAVHEVGAADDGTPFMVMDLVEGASLAARLAEGRVPVEDAARIMRDVARAVEHAHSQGVVHRDLKPQNIMLDAADQALVMDFGLAKLLDATQLTRSGSMLGTVAYMPPEQVDGIAVDARSDVYSLGATLYHALTGRPPFQANGQVALVNAVLTKDPVPPSQLNRRVSLDLETICLRALEKEPGRRYASAAELAQDLQRWVEGEPIAARPLGRLGRLARRARRNKLVTGLVLAMTLVLVAGVGVAGQQTLQRRAEQRERLAAEAAREREHRAQLEGALAVARAEKLRADRTLARVLHERSVAALEEGRSRDAAIYAATALSEGERAGASAREQTSYRAALLSAQQGAWRAPEELLRLPQAGACDFAVSADGRWVVLIGARDAALWDGTTRTSRPLPHPGEGWTRAVAIGPLGALYLGLPTGVQVIDLATTTVRDTIRTPRAPRDLAPSPDGRWLAIGFSSGGVGLFDLAHPDGAVRVFHPEVPSHGQRGQLAWTPAGKLLWATRGVLALDVESGALERPLGDSKTIAVSVAANGNVATGSADGWLRFWTRLAPDDPWSEVAAHASPIRQVVFSADGRVMVTRGHDSRVKVWSLRCALAVTLTFEARPLGVAFVADRQLAVCTADGVVRVHDLEGAVSQSHAQACAVLSCSPDGATLASTSRDRHVYLWDATKDRPGRPASAAFPSNVTAVLVEDATRYVVALQDGGLVRVDRERGRVKIGAHPSAVLFLEAAGPGRVLSAAAGLCLWDLEATPPRPRWTAVAPQLQAVAVDLARGRVATAGQDGAARLWDLETGAAGPVLDSEVALTAVGFLPDGRIVTGDGDGDVLVWDPLGASPGVTIRAHDGLVEDLEVSADGGLLASAGADGVIRLWSVEPLEVLAELRRHRGPVRVVAFDPTGRWLVSGGEDRTLGWWPLRELLHETVPANDVLRETQEGTGLVIKVEQGQVDPTPR